jgi:hypothetical protein
LPKGIENRRFPANKSIFFADFKARSTRGEHCYARASGSGELPDVNPVQQGNFPASDPVLSIANFFPASWMPL